MQNKTKKNLFFSLIFLAIILFIVRVYNGNVWKDDFNLKNLIKSNNIAKIEQAIKSGTNVNQPFNNGSTLLIYAAENGCLEAVKLLLANGADVNLRASNSCTALMCAATQGHSKVVELLFANGADIPMMGPHHWVLGNN